MRFKKLEFELREMTNVMVPHQRNCGTCFLTSKVIFQRKLSTEHKTMCRMFKKKAKNEVEILFNINIIHVDLACGLEKKKQQKHKNSVHYPVIN